MHVTNGSELSTRVAHDTLPSSEKRSERVKSNRIDPYLAHNRGAICEKCAFLHSSCCPCPMDSLAVLLGEVVEVVDERRREHAY